MKNYWDIQDNNMIFIFQYFIKEINRDKNEIITFILAFPICCEVKAKITISCKIEDFWRLIGWGEILSSGNTIPNNYYKIII